MRFALIKVALLIGLFYSIQIHAELFVFSDKSRFSTQDEASFQIDTSIASRTWYSYFSYMVPKYTVGRCVKIPEIASLLKPDEEWLVRLDIDLDNTCVSWSAFDDQWYEILKSIDQQNEHITIWINHSEKTIGWSADSRVVPYLAHRTPLVWRLSEKRSLYENIQSWGDSIGWQVVWQLPIDYPITANSLHFGQAFVSDGVVDQLLSQKVSPRGEHYRTDFDSINKVVRISHNRKEL